MINKLYLRLNLVYKDASQEGGFEIIVASMFLQVNSTYSSIL
jgi:hypothetical protein